MQCSKRLGLWLMLGMMVLSGCKQDPPPPPPPMPTRPPGAFELRLPRNAMVDEDDAERQRAERRTADEKNTQEQPADSKDAASSTSPAQEVVAEFTPSLSAEELADGWLSLFDGRTLFGWNAATKADWQVQDGAIVVTSGEPGLLCTPVQFSDYVLHADFRFAPETNSGIFLHSPLKPTDPKADCYELNIAEPAISPFSTGGFVGRAKAEADAAPNVWHHYEVTVTGGHFVVKLNDMQVLDYTDPKPLNRGYIGLQLNKGKVEFRNLKLKPLGLASLFNGKDLTGWKQYPEMKSEFTVNEAGELRVKGGKGQLETEKSFGDFVVRLDCKTHAPGLNSGLFFRCIPGEEMNGYESQIHNGIKNGNRAEPADCGTGGIFRRVNARLVAANDGEWFTKTIVADGPRIAVWVNGYLVTAWVDGRAPDENPRKGLRTAPGTFMLQGHDPTTDLSFRNLQAAELPARSE